LIEIPSRQVVRERHLYKCQDIKMHWQQAGDYLCVKFSIMKTKKTMATNFEIFRMREKAIPIEMLEMEDNIIAFAWQPNKNCFAIIHGPGETPRPHVSFYQIKRKLKLLARLDDRLTNCLFWSPTGENIVLAGLGPLHGQLEFVDALTCETLISQEHYQCTDVEWDPSGRYVITAVCTPLGKEPWRFTSENGYKLWSHQGQLLANIPIDMCYQVLWRPRPPTLLSADQVKEIQANLKEKYWKKFQEEDDKIRLGNLSSEDRERQMLKERWKAYRGERQKEYEDQREDRRELRHGALSDDEDDYVFDEVTVEEEISRIVELVS